MVNKELIRIDFVSGMDKESIAAKHKCNVQTVYKHVRDLEKAKRDTERALRDAEFIQLYTKEAKTLQEIGEMYGISRERVRQRLAACGVDKLIGGGSLKAVIKKIYTDKTPRKSESRCQAWYGCSLDFRNKYGSTTKKGTLTAAFKNQKNNAAKRNIEWCLTFPEWIKIWEESGHIDERGFGDGKYVMSRLCDMGAYSVDNVRIITHNENSREAREMDKIRAPKKASRPSMKELAAQHGIKYGTLIARLNRGMDMQSALTRAVQNWGR